MSHKAAIRELCFDSLYPFCVMVLAKNVTMIACIVMPSTYHLLLHLFSLTTCSGSRQKGESESESYIATQVGCIEAKHS